MAESKIFLDDEGYKEYLDSVLDVKKEIEGYRNARSALASIFGSGLHDTPVWFKIMMMECNAIDRLLALEKKGKSIEHVEPSGEPGVADIGSTVTYGWGIGEAYFDDIKVKLVARTPRNENEVSINSEKGALLWKKRAGDSIGHSIVFNIVKVEN